MSEKKLGLDPAYPMTLDDCDLRKYGMSKRFYAACQIAPQIINAMYINFETHEIIKKTAEKNNIDEADAVAIMAYEFTDKLLEQENL